MIEQEIPEMDRFLRNFALPEKPHSLLPVVPRNLGDISETELMSLYSEFMSWVNYAQAQLIAAEIVEERGERRHYKYAAEQGQWAALQSQIQAFGSQLSDARNSMVNFGTQLGVGQRATSNNVS